MRSALITGHAGFAGRHFERALAGAGWRTEGIDLADRSGAWRGDARNLFRVSETRYDLVVHCAAIVGGRALIDGPALALASNLELDAGLFQWAERTRPGRVLYLSSPAAYPVDLQCGAGRRLREADLDLSAPRLPDQLYGWAKLTGEMLAARARAGGVPVTIVRPFSGFGEDQSGDYPFPSFAARAAAREDPFAIWGDGAQVRDWVHIDDIVRAALHLAAEGVDGPVNIGTGRPVSMRELASMFARAAGYSPEFRPLPGRPAGVAYRVADVTRLREYYEPGVSLEDGVRRALAARMPAEVPA